MSISVEFGFEFFKTIAPMIVAAGGVAIGLELLKQKLERKLREKYGESQEERISRLTRNLKEATTAISEIESELKERHALAEKVKADYERYEKLASLKEEEVEAVMQALRGELREEGAKSLWKSAAINLVFFLAGVAVTIYMAV
ncbi:hypothetical protein [Sedimenticola selenatireducens]|uniref:Uncharacterized protein n=1 Tax=Sedimenticola selenatireducens TaxID=191960 RepID=A0A2N6CR88_9GAMM|nr:hypothetical protein [Sedimenticola selenatireducens]PLX59581.1 MAG: hypothetical protein C0630_19345 [Sedimenticola selenatireducens]